MGVICSHYDCCTFELDKVFFCWNCSQIYCFDHLIWQNEFNKFCCFKCNYAI